MPARFERHRPEGPVRAQYRAGLSINYGLPTGIVHLTKNENARPVRLTNQADPVRRVVADRYRLAGSRSSQRQARSTVRALPAGEDRIPLR